MPAGSLVDALVGWQWEFDGSATPRPEIAPEWRDIRGHRVLVQEPHESWQFVYPHGEVVYTGLGFGIDLETVIADLSQMPAHDLEAAWAAVHDNTPGGWYVGVPGYEERYCQWSMYAFEPSEKPVVSKRSQEWTTVGRSELECVQVMARCLGELKAGRWPK